MIKRFFLLFSLCVYSVALAGCTTNPATGQSQFTALMSPAQENEVGAQEHKKVIAQYGLYENAKIQNYINTVGAHVAKNTERTDVQYKFFLLDSPIVNAFALPGGYIYLTRGLLALANNEAQMASVLAHETGHITGRHSAERYSRGVVTSLGAAILSSAIGSSGASEALGVGTDLYLKSYSRGQESEADSLGIRYLARSGYSPDAMAGFLSQLQADDGLQAHIEGKSSEGVSYFSTHPATADRVQKTKGEAAPYNGAGVSNTDHYLQMIDGLIFGDSPEQGFVRGNDFYHTELGFKFSVPDGYKIINRTNNVLAVSDSGALMIFDFAKNENMSVTTFMRQVWLKDKPDTVPDTVIEAMKVNGMNAATAGLVGTVNGRNAQIRLIAIEWKKDRFARFQVVVPDGLSNSEVDALKSATYSFSALSASEKSRLKPYRIKILVAKSGDSVSSLASRMSNIDANGDFRQARFRTLNGMAAGDQVKTGKLYKIITE